MHSKWTMSEEAKAAALRIFEHRTVYFYSDFEALIQSAIDKATATKDARIKELKDALSLAFEYMRHAPGCSGEFPQYRCKCGFIAASEKVDKLSKEGE